MRYKEIKDHRFKIEITKEEMENAMLVPGEYIVEDGRYYTILGMLTGHLEKEEVEFDYSAFTFDPDKNTLIQDKDDIFVHPILKDDDIL